MSELIGSLVIGAIIGWAAAKITKSKGGLVRNIVIGILGSALGPYLANMIGLNVTSDIMSLLVSIGGACVLIIVGKFLFK